MEKPNKKKKLIALNIVVLSNEPKCLEILKTNAKVIYNKYNSYKLKTKIPTKGKNEYKSLNVETNAVNRPYKRGSHK